MLANNARFWKVRPMPSRDLEGNAIERHHAAEADREGADGEQRQVAGGGLDGHFGRFP
jgi:hypothetical protein